MQNFPTVGLIDGNFRQNLEETGMSYEKEVTPALILALALALALTLARTPARTLAQTLALTPTLTLTLTILTLTRWAAGPSAPL